MSGKHKAAWTALALVTAAGGAHAQSGAAFPSKPMRIVVGYAAGGPNDIVARALAQKLTEALGQQVVVDNRPGADGIIGTDLVAKSPPDGHTLALVSPSHTINPAVQTKLPYDPIRDFSPVTLAAAGPTLLLVHPSLPVKSVKELVAFAKARPGELHYGSSGAGGTLHLAGELLRSRTGIDISHVPYKGVAPATIDLLAGQISLMFNPIVAALPHVKGGKLRPLAVTSTKRTGLLPELPTMEEAGVSDFEVVIWYGLLAPAKTPRAAVDRLNAELVRIVQSADMKDRFATLGAEPFGLSVDAFGAFLATDLAKWGKLVKATGLKIQ
jgi:tripartite-type tricarboxylate transporter receptor subunit TctC